MKNLNADLKNGTFLQVYLLTGEEAYLKNRYKKRLRAALVGEDDLMNFTAYTGKGIDIRQVIETAETMPFFAERRLIQIEDSGFFKNACPELAEYLPTMPKETYMVFVEQEIDKRGKLYKAVKAQGRIVELGRQDARTLTTWVLGMIKKEGKNITQDALNLFLEKSGDDMENIANELEKLLCYVQDMDTTKSREVITAAASSAGPSGTASCEARSSTRRIRSEPLIAATSLPRSGSDIENDPRTSPSAIFGR